MNSPFLNGSLDGLEHSCLDTGSLIEIGLGSSPKDNSPSTSPSSPAHQEESIHEAALVHSKSDEHLFPRTPACSAPYTSTSSIAPWIFAGTHPVYFGFNAVPEGSPGILPNYYPQSMVHGVDPVQQDSLPPWRSVLHGSYPSDGQSTLCPTQLVPVPELLPHEETFVSPGDWDTERLSVVSDHYEPALPSAHPYHGLQVDDEETEDASHSHPQPRKHRRSHPDGLPRPYPSEPAINPSTGTAYQPIYTKPSPSSSSSSSISSSSSSSSSSTAPRPPNLSLIHI